MTETMTMTIRSGGTQQVDALHHRVSLIRGPWDDAEISPDARHETAPRHRGLIGGHVPMGQGYEEGAL